MAIFDILSGGAHILDSVLDVFTGRPEPLTPQPIFYPTAAPAVAPQASMGMIAEDVASYERRIQEGKDQMTALQMELSQCRTQDAPAGVPDWFAMRPVTKTLSPITVTGRAEETGLLSLTPSPKNVLEVLAHLLWIAHRGASDSTIRSRARRFRFTHQTLTRVVLDLPSMLHVWALIGMTDAQNVTHQQRLWLLDKVNDALLSQPGKKVRGMSLKTLVRAGRQAKKIYKALRNVGVIHAPVRPTFKGKCK